MKESIIKYMGLQAKVVCDGKCEKAFGINGRPRIFLSSDPDDFEWLADREVGTDPRDTGVYEGGVGKPTNSDSFPTKWCVRECERCSMSKPGCIHHPLILRSFERRVPNKVA